MDIGEGSSVKTGRQILGVCAAILFFATVARAQSATLPTVDQILTRYVKAIGGEAAVRKLTSRLSTGSLETQEGPALSVEMWVKAPDKFRFEVTIPNGGWIVQAYDGVSAWDANSQEGMRDLAGSARANRIRNAQFYREVALKQLYRSMRVTGVTKMGELDVYVVEAVPADGPADTYYFAAASGLLLRRDSNYEDQGQNVSFQTYYEDYREVDGVMLPFALRRTGADNSNFTIRFSMIQHNIPIDDAKFSKPAPQ
jgi:outer membrane lipoprotein-sorting protein